MFYALFAIVGLIVFGWFIRGIETDEERVD